VQENGRNDVEWEGAIELGRAEKNIDDMVTKNSKRGVWGDGSDLDF